MRVSRVVSALNWKHAVGEVVLIVVGISIALGADSWRQQRQAYRDETETLQQILVALEADREALATTAADVAHRAELLIELRDHLAEGLSDDTGLEENFRVLRRWQTSRMNTAAYQDLQARGLSLVSNPELRVFLIDYYQRAVPRLENRDRIDEENTRSYSTSVLQKHLTWRAGEYIPVDYARTAADPEFLFMVAAKANTTAGATVSTYQETIELTDQLIEALETELSGRQ